MIMGARKSKFIPLSQRSRTTLRIAHPREAKPRVQAAESRTLTEGFDDSFEGQNSIAIVFRWN